MAIYPELAGKTAIVTGGSTGIGEAVCLALAECGANVVVNGSRNAEAAERVAAAVDAAGGRGLAVLADVSRAEGVRTLVERAERELGPVDILVNNAGGFTKIFRVVEMPEEEWDQVVELNLKSAFLCSKAVLPGMIERRWGRIVNVASEIARMPLRVLSASYAAGKAGMLGLTRHLALEVAEYGITVNATCPGTTYSPRIRKLYDTPEKHEFVASQVPLGRLAEPEEQAGIVAFLCSNGGSYITGATIDVGGGKLMI